MKYRTDETVRSNQVEEPGRQENAQQKGDRYFPADKCPQHQINPADQKPQTEGGADAAELPRRQRGLVNMLHLPARFGRTLPYLTGLALAWAAETARADGDDEAAAVLTAELDRRFPSHPARAADPVLPPAIARGTSPE